jgi:hypothetical protein
MNPLSKLLYFGNVAGNLGGFCVFLGIVFLIVAVVTFIVHNVMMGEILEKLKYSRGDDNELVKKAMKYHIIPFWSPFFLFLSVVVWTLAAFTPSQDTVYAIAASEVVGKALASPLATKTEQALEAWLDSKIKAVQAPPPTDSK